MKFQEKVDMIKNGQLNQFELTTMLNVFTGLHSQEAWDIFCLQDSANGTVLTWAVQNNIYYLIEKLFLTEKHVHVDLEDLLKVVRHGNSWGIALEKNDYQSVSIIMTGLLQADIEYDQIMELLDLPDSNRLSFANIDIKKNILTGMKEAGATPEELLDLLISEKHEDYPILVRVSEGGNLEDLKFFLDLVAEASPTEKLKLLMHECEDDSATVLSMAAGQVGPYAPGIVKFILDMMRDLGASKADFMRALTRRKPDEAWTVGNSIVMLLADADDEIMLAKVLDLMVQMRFTNEEKIECLMAKLNNTTLHRITSEKFAHVFIRGIKEAGCSDKAWYDALCDKSDWDNKSSLMSMAEFSADAVRVFLEEIIDRDKRLKLLVDISDDSNVLSILSRYSPEYKSEVADFVMKMIDSGVKLNHQHMRVADIDFDTEGYRSHKIQECEVKRGVLKDHVPPKVLNKIILLLDGLKLYEDEIEERNQEARRQEAIAMEERARTVGLSSPSVLLSARSTPLHAFVINTQGTKRDLEALGSNQDFESQPGHKKHKK